MHAIKVCGSFPFHGTFDLVQLFSLGFHDLIFVGRGLPSSFRGGSFAAWTLVFVIVSITSYQRSVVVLRTSSVLEMSSLLEFCVLLHQLLDSGCLSSDLLSHHD